MSRDQSAPHDVDASIRVEEGELGDTLLVESFSEIRVCHQPFKITKQQIVTALFWFSNAVQRHSK